ncbi:MAG TPA: HlyD family efflux transporter periplasmic adaptor subunit [Vicinamibacterales bacterium]|jgi:HlyD family secretion protein|nr:HlyD family efflux transporter periplasmic adaptor subunit [Vicinamibacterales bacterium]
MVDIARPNQAKKKRIKRILWASVAVVAVAAISLGVSRLKPAAPSVDRAVVWIDSVKRGPMLRQVRGSGTLVPEDIRWITMQAQGRVERIVLRPGAIVTPDTVILELSNPELEQSVRAAQLDYQSAQAAFTNRKAELESSLLSQEATVANIETQYKQAELDLKANEELYKEKLISLLTLEQKRGLEKDLKNRLAVEQKRLSITRDGLTSQLAPQEADVNQRKAQWELRRKQLDDLKVKAGMSGTLQLVPVERGQQVGPGTNLARVANPTNLKAELRIAETQTKDIRIGQYAEVDTRNGIVKGHVSRIDPASSGGTVGVDVVMDGPLPPGARPDLSVDGTVQLERLDNIVFVGRPAFGQENSTVTIFKVGPTGEAVATKVKLGRASVNTIEVIEGLNPGDQVILSDMSQYDAFDRVQLKG